MAGLLAPYFLVLSGSLWLAHVCDSLLLRARAGDCARAGRAGAADRAGLEDGQVY